MSRITQRCGRLPRCLRPTGAGESRTAKPLSGGRSRPWLPLALLAATAVLGAVAALAVHANTPADYFVYYLAGLRLAAKASPYQVPLSAGMPLLGRAG